LHIGVGNRVFVNDLNSNLKTNYLSWNKFNDARYYKFKDLDSKNLQFLTSEKSLRLLGNTKFSMTNLSLGNSSNVATKQNNDLQLSSTLLNNYKNTANNNINSLLVSKALSLNLNLTGEHNPIHSSNIKSSKVSYDKLNKYSVDEVPNLYKGKEEGSLEYLFNTY
jgi:hypothetical protein